MRARVAGIQLTYLANVASYAQKFCAEDHGKIMLDTCGLTEQIGINQVLKIAFFYRGIS